MTLPTISVSQLNSHIKKLIDADLMFSSVLITGEISNFSPHYQSGHLYFSLKDEKSAVKAVMFERDAARLRFRPADGMKVIAAGRVSVFERDGIYQLYVRELIPDGAGELSVAFEQLKKRLEAKGLFDAAHKKELPLFPRRIGIITSPGGAALQDMLNILKRRYPICEVVIAGVTVQGSSAPARICEAIKELNRLHAVDLIILGRGGGSAEDLWCFNDETLAYEIYQSKLPVISAIGHETDFTIADFVSDLRAPTPSAAAELAVPDQEELLYRTDMLLQRLFALINNEIGQRAQKLQLLCSGHNFSDPKAFFAEDRHRVQTLMQRMLYLQSAAVSAENERFLHLQKRLRLNAAQFINARRLQLTHAASALEKLDPLRVLLRGYAIVQTADGIKESATDFSVNEDVKILLYDGTLEAKITAIKAKED